ncbi:MAG TPA: hypothetical protein VFF06_35355 [Polyangia bacterium]|nr:hypothetical protein [Polyangia bacterium]
MWFATLVTAMAAAAASSPPRERVLVVPLGDFPRELVPGMAESLEAELDVEVRVGPRLELPRGALAFDDTFSAEALIDFLDEAVFAREHRAEAPLRAPLDADLDTLLDWLGEAVERARHGPHAADAVLGLATVPLGARLDHGLREEPVSGLTVGGSVAVLTLYGYRPREWQHGAIEVAIHEIAHTLGLRDTGEEKCVMNGHAPSRGLPGSEHLCAKCRARLEQLAPR